MGVYIKGMQMPENCSECISLDLRTTIKCTEWTEISAGRRENERAWSCPLVDLGEHGDLIDVESLNIHDISPVNGFCVMGVTEEDIGLAKKVIEAEDRT